MTPTPHTDTDTDLPPLTPYNTIPANTPIGTVVDHWHCPSCDRTIDIIHRPGRPRLYCSHACRQRAYRWRRHHHAHTTATPTWPAEAANARSTYPSTHALRNPRDPLARRRDRRGREVTVCGLLARPPKAARVDGHRQPYIAADPTRCRTCNALLQPRPHGLVPPGALQPPHTPDPHDIHPGLTALQHIHPDYPLPPNIRYLLHLLHGHGT